jgi:hypothetical protein
MPMVDKAAYLLLELMHVPLIPAQAGIQSNKRWSSRPWIPAGAGTSGKQGAIPSRRNMR